MGNGHFHAMDIDYANTCCQTPFLKKTASFSAVGGIPAVFASCQAVPQGQLEADQE